MNVRLLHQIPPAPDNPRNSEGAFLRGKQGEILFAYSRYHGDSSHDHAACDIALIVSHEYCGKNANVGTVLANLESKIKFG